MVLHKKISDLVAPVFYFTTFSKILGLIKASLVIGSIHSFFSLSNTFTPLAGKKGFGFATMVASLHLLIKWLVFGSVGYSALAFVVPGWCASLYWASDRLWIRALLPAVCIILFVAHPVGRQAAPYALYWLIPMVLCMSGWSTTFATALGSTFVAHAVGSVIWLYTVPMAVGSWYALIPLVAIERLLYATGMTGFCYLHDWALNQEAVAQPVMPTKISA